MEMLRYVTASPIPTKYHIYESHSKGPRRRQTMEVKLNYLEKYLTRLERLKVKARRADNVESLLALCVKAEKVSSKIASIQLHGRVKRHVHKRVKRAQEELSALLQDAIVNRDSSLDSTSGTESDEGTEPASSDSEIKYHITLEEVPDEDGI